MDNSVKCLLDKKRGQQPAALPSKSQTGESAWINSFQPELSTMTQSDCLRLERIIHAIHKLKDLRIMEELVYDETVDDE